MNSTKRMNRIWTSLLGCGLLFFSTPSEGKDLKISLESYRDKVYAEWLAQCVGNIYGLPHENKYIDNPGPDRFPLGNSNSNLIRESNGAFSDDDTDFEYMYLQAMEKYGIEPTYAQLATDWKYHVRDRVWLANRAALAAMHYGYTPPVTGFKEINPHWFQIDPQLINEIWAVTAPGMVRYATSKSAWAARIMEECGGWFESISAEYRDSEGNWKPVEQLIVNPPFPSGNDLIRKPHFVEYLLAFQPVQTTAIRIIGKAGGIKPFSGKEAYYTSITELGAYGPLPGFEKLN